MGAPLPDVTAAVVALSRRDGASALPQTLFSRFEATDFHEALRAFAHDHQVLGLVLVEVERAAVRLPAPIAAENRRLLKQLRLQAALWDLERDQVASRFRDRGIPVVVLKGAALRVTAYRDSAERPFGDIDLLVPKEALPDAVGLLEAQGYARHSEHRDRIYLEHFHHLVVSKAPGFKVEVHWALAPAHSTLALDPEAFRRAAVPVETAPGHAFLVPAPEHMAIHLAAQNLDDGLSTLRRLVDLDRVITAAGAGFDWGRLGSEARRMGATAAVGLSLRLCQILLGTAVPPGFVGGLGLSRAVRVHLALLDPVKLVVERRGKDAAVRGLLTIWCTPSSAGRWRLIRDMATGRRERAWRELLRQERGALPRLAALLQIGAMQALRYPVALTGRLSVRGFWGEG